jgi:hypothetical protein
MSKATVSNAGRVRPGDRIVADNGPVFVARVVKARGRKPRHGENLMILGYESVTARKAREIKVNSLDPIKIMGRPLTSA